MCLDTTLKDIIFCLRCNGMQDYKVHSGESYSTSNFRDSSIVILFFVGILFLVAILGCIVI